MSTYKIIISGKVQVVFYRRFAKINADRLGIVGYVKNLSNGDVEVICKGDKKTMDLFLEELKKGNPYSNVENLEIKQIPEISLDGFEIRE